MRVFAVVFLLMVGSAWAEDNCTAEYSCVNCIAVRICEQTPSGYQEVSRFNCPSSHPYCDVTGSCSSLPTLECADMDTFPCTQEGIFPHPSDCQKYRVCKNGTSHVLQCPLYNNFDSAQGTCVSGATCYTISCSSKSGVKVPYSNDHGIYAYCFNELPILVERCPGSYQLDTTLQKCVPACQAAGNRIPDAFNCTNYFSCSLEPYASTFTVTSQQCPQGYGFDPRFLRCVPLKALPSCQPFA